MEYPIIALCMKAISDPSSISRAERNLINCRPPPGEEDDLCIAQCGLDMKSLASKAISYSSFPLSNSPLSGIEATILHSGVDCLTLKDRITYFTTKSNFSNYLTQLMGSARRALISPRTETIIKIARHVVRQLHKIPKADDEALEMAYSSECLAGGPTMELVGDWMKYTPWGLICVRTHYGDEAAWNTFIRSTNAIARRELRKLISNDSRVDSFDIMCIENAQVLPDADPLSIRSFFAVGATEDRYPLDFRLDYFLVADENIIAASSNPGAKLRISIWEADFDPVLTNDAGYNGAIDVPVQRLVSVVFPSIVSKEKEPLKRFLKDPPLNS